MLQPPQPQPIRRRPGAGGGPPSITGARSSNRVASQTFRNNGAGGRAGGGGGGAMQGGPPGQYGGVGPVQPVGGGMFDPGQASGALMTGSTTYTAQNDPLLMENVQNLRGRMSADVTTAQKDKAKADISNATASQQKQIATAAARSGGGGAANEMAGDLADKSVRTEAGALTNIDIEAEKRKDALTMGGQGIYAAPGARNLEERGFQANVDAGKAAQALAGANFNAGNYWQGQNFNAGRQDAGFNQAMQYAQYMNPGGGQGPRAPRRSGGVGGGIRF